MTRFLLTVAVAVVFTPGLAFSQTQTQLHRIDTRSANGLRELFHYDGCTMPLLSAHRGGAVTGFPENCIATFEHTLQHTFSILEIDLQCTNDGHIVLHHDSTLDRTTTGTGPVANRTLKELQQLRLKDNDGNVTEYRIPTLDEALQWARGKTIVILDKKQVPVDVCVQKIQEHRAQAYAMVMAYSFDDIQTCHKLDADIMMEVMIGNQQRLRGFEAVGVPWNRIVSFVGHSPPEDRKLLEQIHAQGVCCMAGTSRNLDRQLRVASDQESEELKRNYQARIDFGIDLIETDLPVQLGALLYDPPGIPDTKARFFDGPSDAKSSQMERVDDSDTNDAFAPDPSVSADDALSRWRSGVQIHPVAPDKMRHSIHAYFNISPESPDGKYVLYYSSATADGETGEIRIVERSSGREQIIASNITTEDAHRAACQQWASGGKTVVYHDCRDGRWRVMAVDLGTFGHRILAEDRQVGFGSAQQDWIPVYGCHWNPGPHRDLELVHVETGEIRKPVTAERVVEEYGDWVQEKFGTTGISIFFPMLSPDGQKVFFKLARPSGIDDFRSKQASYREGKVVFDLANHRFIRLIEKWGHPSWDSQSKAIFEKGNFLIDVETGRSKRCAPSSPSNHPSLSPDGTTFVTDADVSRREFGKPGDWAIVVGDTTEDRFVVVDQFNDTGGAKSWRRPHPHPAFSADGRRIYYNVSEGDWTRLFVAECAK